MDLYVNIKNTEYNNKYIILLEIKMNYKRLNC